MAGAGISGVAGDFAQELDAMSGLGWFCDAIENDLTGTGLVEIACRHAASTPGFPVTEARFRKAGTDAGGSARRFFSVLGAIANTSPGWPVLRDALATGMAEIAHKIAACEGFRAGQTGGSPSSAPAADAMPPRATPAPAAAEPATTAVRETAPEVDPQDRTLLPFVALLPPPPPEGAKEMALVDWLGGRPWHPLTLGMSFADGTVDLDEMMEIEREVLLGSSALLKREDIRGPQDPDRAAEHAKFLIAMSDHLGEGVERDGLEARIDTACRSVLDRYWKTEARVMRAMGARFTVGAEALQVCAAALDVERFLIGTGIEGRDTIPLGTPAPDGAIRPGHVLERAAALHLSGRAGIPLAEALCDALVEIRWAQAMREFGDDDAVPLQRCENLFHKDFQAPLTAYRQVREVEEVPEP